MNMLIDSHVLIWSYFEPIRLSSTASTAITDPNNRVFVSPASYWEIAIKISIGKLQLAESFNDFVQHAIFDNGFTILAIEPDHAAELVSLSYHHRDPFDRLIIAQAIVDKMAVVSADQTLDLYPVQRLW